MSALHPIVTWFRNIISSTAFTLHQEKHASAAIGCKERLFLYQVRSMTRYYGYHTFKHIMDNLVLHDALLYVTLLATNAKASMD